MRARALQERGSVFALFAVMVTIFVGMLAFSVDAGFIHSSKSQQRQLADAIALGAIEAFVGTIPPPGSSPEAAFDFRKARALERAQELLGLRGNFLLGDFLTMRSAGGASTPLSLVAAHPSNFGSVVFGSFYRTEPASPPTSYNCGFGTTFRPCFVAHAPSDPPTANAVRVTLQLPSSNLLRTLFGRLLGIETVQISTASTAMIIPRRILFGLDLSRSMDDDSHAASAAYPAASALRVEPTGSYLAELDQILDLRGGRSLRQTPILRFGVIPCSDIEPALLGLESYLFTRPEDATFWGLMRPIRPSVGAVDPHYRSDYFCVRVPVPDNGSTHDEWYLIDGRTPAQPLTNALAAVNNTLQLLQLQGIAGDRVGFIGFDHDILTPRAIPSFDPFAPTLPANFSLIGPTTADPRFAELLAITSSASALPTTPVDWRRRIRDHLLFLRVDRRHRSSGGADSFEPPTAYTDIPYVTEKVLNLFRDSDEGFETQSHLVLVGDGLSNCEHVSQTNNAIVECSGTYDTFTSALAKTLAFNQRFADEKVSFNMVLLGQVTRPHTLLYRSERDAAGGCMDEDEVRSQIPPLPWTNAVNYGPAGDDISFACYPNSLAAPFCNGQFFGPGAFFPLVRNTGGIWAPVRPPCPDPVVGSPPNDCALHVIDFLNAKCASAAITVPPQPVPISETVYGDSRGRLVCDAKCRDQSAQIAEAFTSIVRYNPLMLVSE